MSLVRSLGYDGVAFESAEALLSSGAAMDSSCIVTDIQMPGMTGIELEAQLRQEGFETPVILITARTEPDLLQAARDSGALCILRKPFDAGALINCLEQAMS